MLRKTKKFWSTVKDAVREGDTMKAVDLLARAGFAGNELDCALEAVMCNLLED